MPHIFHTLQSGLKSTFLTRTSNLHDSHFHVYFMSPVNLSYEIYSRVITYETALLHTSSWTFGERKLSGKRLLWNTAIKKDFCEILLPKETFVKYCHQKGLVWSTAIKKDGCEILPPKRTFVKYWHQKILCEILPPTKDFCEMLPPSKTFVNYCLQQKTFVK